jgi:hypothetical protein
MLCIICRNFSQDAPLPFHSRINLHPPSRFVLRAWTFKQLKGRNWRIIFKFLMEIRCNFFNHWAFVSLMKLFKHDDAYIFLKSHLELSLFLKCSCSCQWHTLFYDCHQVWSDKVFKNRKSHFMNWYLKRDSRNETEVYTNNTASRLHIYLQVYMALQPRRSTLRENMFCKQPLCLMSSNTLNIILTFILWCH